MEQHELAHARLSGQRHVSGDGGGCRLAIKDVGERLAAVIVSGSSRRATFEGGPTVTSWPKSERSRDPNHRIRAQRDSSPMTASSQVARVRDLIETTLDRAQ